MINTLLTKNWWLFLLRGVVMIFIGILALLVPGVTFATLVLFLGAFMFIDGIFSIIGAFSHRKTTTNWVWMLILGMLGIIIGIITFINPFATAMVLLFMVAFWAIVTGIAEIALAIRLRKVIKGEGWYIFTGIVSILFGILIFVNPVAGAFGFTMLFGIYALLFGVMLVSLSIRLRHRHRPSSGRRVAVS